MEDPYLRAIFDGKTRPYDPALKVHPGAPEKRVYDAFGPGQRDALAQQLAAMFGGGQEQVAAQGANLDRIYDDTTSTYVPTPVTQIMADFAKNKYQQHGQDTGSVFLNSLLGYAPNSTMQIGLGGTPVASVPAASPTTSGYGSGGRLDGEGYGDLWRPGYYDR